MVRTTDSPWNNTPQKPHTFEDLKWRYARAVVIDGGSGVFNGEWMKRLTRGSGSTFWDAICVNLWTMALEAQACPFLAHG